MCPALVRRREVVIKTELYVVVGRQRMIVTVVRDEAARSPELKIIASIVGDGTARAPEPSIIVLSNRVGGRGQVA